MERRFQPVMVGEPSEDEAVEILKGLKDRYEAHHKVTITDEAIDAAVKLSAPIYCRPLPARQGHRPHRRGRLPGAAAHFHRP